jgi:serine/threonine protein kinase/Tfp pilus assembly protein PilF
MIQDLTTNTTLSHYRIVSKLGAGGMGEVYLAEDTRLRRKVALKVLPEEIARDAERLLRFEREAFAASALNHPNILTIHEFAAVDDKHFLASEFVRGETLRDRLNRERLTLADTLDIAVQIASALQAAHEAGIIHRDIKPENLMLREDGYIKVLDFGLAKLVEQPGLDEEAETRRQLRTQDGVVMGTVAYMSPEQARGQEVDGRSDVWSLGCVMYELLTRRQPFQGDTVTDVLANIIHQEPEALQRYRKDLPAELEGIVQNTLRKNRDERYVSAKALLTDVRQLQLRLLVDSEIERSSAPDRKAEAETQILHRVMEAAEETPTTEARRQTSADSPKSRRAMWLMALLSLVVLVGGFFAYRYIARDTKAIESIAVMPFVNEGGNQEVDYLSEGMTETLIRSLSQLPKLNVKARSSVFRYKGKETNAQTLGKELNVQAILNGRVVQRGEQLTLSLELVDAQTENVIWSEQYNRKQTDLVLLQSEIAKDVSSKLKTKLSGVDEAKVTKNYTANPEAYQFYLRGRFYWNKRTEKDFQKAIEHFHQAIALDPNYALAYAGLADAYALLASFGFTPPAEGMTKAREFAQKALSLDDSLAEPHTTIAMTLFAYAYDFAGAEREYKRAIELTPNYATAHQWYGEMLTCNGRFEEAFAEYRRGLELEPLSLPINWDYGRSFYQARKFDEAIAQHIKTIELDGSFARAHRTLSEVYRAKGDYAKAIEEQARNFDLGGEPQNAALTREAFARGGWTGYLRLVTAENSSLKDRHFIVAKAYAELGEKDKAFAELNKSFENRESPMQWLKVEPLLDPLRSDPRFQELLKKVGFAQ